MRSSTLDKPLILRSGLLAFWRIQGQHTGENLATVLYGVIKEAGIEKRVCKLLIAFVTSEYMNS